MQALFVLILICHVAYAVKHSLKYFLTATSGLPDFPEFVGAAMVDEVQVGYCDSSIKSAEPKQDWMKTLIHDDPHHLEWYTQKCLGNQQKFRANIYKLNERLNQTEGAHILQRMNGCEWDDETGEIIGFNQYGYDGEDFIVLDLKTLTWTAARSQAVVTKLRWDTERDRLEYNKNYYIHKCPERLKKYVAYGKKFLQRTEVSSVSLLQRSPLSPVTCHATGFYPHRAVIFWRRDGEEVHENVEHGEILPNNDGTFQMSVNMDLSSVKPENWGRYDCVFQLSGAQDSYVIQLNKAAIRTNRGPPSESHVGYVIGLVVGLLFLLLAIVGTLICKRNNGFHLVQFDRGLKFSFTGFFGDPDTPEFTSTAELNGLHLMHYDSIIRGAEPKQKWMEQMMKERPEPTDWYMNECSATHRFFSETAESMMQGINQTGGVRVFQRQSGCWETNEPGRFESYDLYAFDGETVMTFDPETQTWMAQEEEAVDIRNKWNNDNTGLAHVLGFLKDCPEWLMMYYDYGKEDLRIKLPSVSFLQKSPFSFVSCHATGFYPQTVKLHWRRVGTVSVMRARYGGLPNNDGTYQLSVNMNVASHEDWAQYECVFQFSRVTEAIVVRLNKTLIRTNWGNFPSEHSLKFLVTQSFGVTSFPKFVGVMMADDVEVSYCDSYNMTATPKKDWMKELMEADAQVKEWFVSHCHSQQHHLNMFIAIIMEMFQHSNGIHTFQMMTSFERKGDSGDIISSFQYGYDGEDFIKFDMDTKTWVASNEHANEVKSWWDRDQTAIGDIMTHFNRQCPDLLRKFSLYGNSSMLRTELPLVYLLQKSPSSPITCHATGFYPDKAKLFWRKDGEEIHNDTEPTESLPNDDDTFQMSVDLNISSIQPEDWNEYDCVFQLLGVQHNNVTKLDRAVIRTNWKTTQNSSGLNIGLYIGLYVFRGFGLLFLFAVGITGYYMWRREKKGFRPAKRNRKVRKGRRGVINWNI